MTRNQLQSAMRRLHSGALSNSKAAVYIAEETYAAGDGYTVRYPSTPAYVIDVRAETPSSAPEKARSGTTAEADLIIRVRDDAAATLGWGEQEWSTSAWGASSPAEIPWTGYGASGDATTRVALLDGDGWGEQEWSTSAWGAPAPVYEIEDVLEERNGLTQLTATEV